MPDGVTVTLVALGGACIVFAAFALGGRSASRRRRRATLSAISSRIADAPGRAASARRSRDLSPRDVTFPQMLSDDDQTVDGACRRAPGQPAGAAPGAAHSRRAAPGDRSATGGPAPGADGARGVPHRDATA